MGNVTAEHDALADGKIKILLGAEVHQAFILVRRHAEHAKLGPRHDRQNDRCWWALERLDRFFDFVGVEVTVDVLNLAAWLALEQRARLDLHILVDALDHRVDALEEPLGHLGFLGELGLQSVLVVGSADRPKDRRVLERSRSAEHPVKYAGVKRHREDHVAFLLVVQNKILDRHFASPLLAALFFL